MNATETAAEGVRFEDARIQDELHRFQELLFSPETFDPDVRPDNLEEFVSSNQALLSVIDSIPNGVTVLSTDLKVLYLNQTMQRWFAKDNKNYRIKCHRLFHNGQRKPCENCPAFASMETKAPSSAMTECGHDEETGQPFLHHILTLPILNRSGEVVLILEYSYNLTEQRKLTRTVEDAQRKALLLEQENLLLRRSLAESEQHLRDLEDAVRSNMDGYVRPTLEYLQSKLSTEEQRIVSSMIEEAVFPITRRRSSRITNLTSREIQVASMIKEGRSSKQIADDLCISKKAVDYHRANLRKKLKIDRSTNLQVYLSVYM